MSIKINGISRQEVEEIVKNSGLPEAVVIVDIPEYETKADLPPVTGTEIDIWAVVRNDVNTNLNGYHCIYQGDWLFRYAITDLKAPFIKGINEIDLNSPDIEDGQDFRLNNDGQENNANKYLTNFIPVTLGERLGKLNTDRFRFYYRDKTPVPATDPAYEGTNRGDNAKVSFDYIKFVRFSCNISDKGVNDMVVRSYNKIAGADPIGWGDYHSCKRDNDKYTYENDGRVFENDTTNLYDFKKVDYTQGFLASGAQNGSFYSSNKIFGVPNARYTHNLGNQGVTFWDRSDNFISGLVGSSFIFPESADYFLILHPRATDIKASVITQNTKVNEVRNIKVSAESLKAKKLNKDLRITVIGDSIQTEAETFATDTSLGTLLRDSFNLETHLNISSSGKSFRTYQMNNDSGSSPLTFSHIYLFALGTNDFGFNRPIGNIDTSVAGDDDTFGAIKDLVNDITLINPSAEIAFFTPFPRADRFDENTQGHSLQDFANAIKDFCYREGFLCKDLFTESVLDFSNDELNNLYSKGNAANGNLPDGLHLNNLAHFFETPAIFKFVDSVISRLRNRVVDNSDVKFGSFTNLARQTFAVEEVAEPILFDTVEFSRAINKLNNSEFEFLLGGVYQLTVEPQLLRSGNGGGSDRSFNLWIQKDFNDGNGFVNLQDTNIKSNAAGVGTTSISPLTETILLNRGDKIRFMGLVANLQLVLEYTPEDLTRGIPATPSVILNVVRIK